MFSLRYAIKMGCTLACAVLMVGATFAAVWSSEEVLKGDSYIDAGAEDDNFGTEEILWVSSEDDEPVKESWLYFDTNEIKEALGIESADDVVSATLKIYAQEVEAEGEVEIHFYNEGFYEETIVWEGKPDYDEEDDANIDVSEEGWCEVDVTDIVKKAIEECPDCPFSMVLVADDDASVGFASKEDSDGNVPELTVETGDE
ncbi:MAG TPA: DNRLRE domain-containing protein [Methanothrix sp.]|nr:DNRLRE domain-containing protein [Methanothrix sp.]